MGVHEGRGQLAKAIKDLNRKWLETKGSWDDNTSVQFEKRHVVPIERDLRNAIAAMDAVAVHLASCRRDCEG
jgi:hypothetical protein